MFKSAFPDKKQMAELTAKMFLEVEAVHFRSDEPYRFTSGLASPVYIDCRKLISFPRVRRILTDFSVSVILSNIGFESVNGIAGGETAGIPFAAWIADRLMLPMQYVRKKPKGFGRTAQIEGTFSEGDKILLVEDLATDGQSKVNFCEALRKAGAIASQTFVLFYYDIFAETKEVLKNMDMQMHYLATWWDILDQCKTFGYFDEKTLAEVESFLYHPMEWSSAHGGTASLNPA